MYRHKTRQVVFSASGKMSSHAEAMAAKARRVTRPLIKFRYRFTSLRVKTLTHLYKTLVKPISLYGAELTAALPLAERCEKMWDTSQNIWARAVLARYAPRHPSGRSPSRARHLQCSHDRQGQSYFVFPKNETGRSRQTPLQSPGRAVQNDRKRNK